MKYKFMAITLLFLLLSSCSSSGVSILKEEPTETPFPTSTATLMPTSTPLPTPTEKPSPVVPVVASVQEENLTDNARVFYAVAKTLGLDLHVVKCLEESRLHGYLTYSTDSSLCYIPFFDPEDFPLDKPEEQSGMYMLLVTAGWHPGSDGKASIAILNSSYLSYSVKKQLKAFNYSNEEYNLLIEAIALPEDLRGWSISDIVPLSNEQVDLLYGSDLITIEH